MTLGEAPGSAAAPIVEHAGAEVLRTPALANGLGHSVLTWAPGSGAADARGAIMLVHGYMDAAATWDRVASALAARGLRVYAPDMRGFGESARAPRGSYYHFADYVADLADLVDILSPEEPIALVGHSMGGVIATLFAGAYPERVSRLANLEGLGPPDNAFEAGPARMRRWIDGVRATRARGEPTPMTRDDALRRLALNHPGVAREVLEGALGALARDATGGEGGEGGLVWRFDPLHRTTSPTPFFADLFVEFAKRVTCPVLFVSGGATGYHVADEEERLAAFPRLTRATLEGAGHMMHWTRPADLARLVAELAHA